MTHDIFPFVNVFVVTNILTRNYHEFLFYFKFVAIYYTIYDLKKIIFLDFKNYESLNLKKYGFENLKIISTKGHSDDSVSLVLEDKYLFCGDLIQNIIWNRPLIPLFGDDFDELLISWKKIIDSKYTKIYPAMKNPVSLKDLERIYNKYEKNRI